MINLKILLLKTVYLSSKEQVRDGGKREVNRYFIVHKTIMLIISCLVSMTMV